MHPEKEMEHEPVCKIIILTIGALQLTCKQCAQNQRQQAFVHTIHSTMVENIALMIKENKITENMTITTS